MKKTLASLAALVILATPGSVLAGDNIGTGGTITYTDAGGTLVGAPTVGGDIITAHAGIYRERINPPRGGTSDAQRITYQAARGETVVITGSEVVTNWVKIDADLWQAVVLNSFFGSTLSEG